MFIEKHLELHVERLPEEESGFWRRNIAGTASGVLELGTYAKFGKGVSGRYKCKRLV